MAVSPTDALRGGYLVRSDRSPQMAKTRLLIVEDQRLFLELMVGLCERDFGFEVAGTASSGEEAIRKAKTISPDLVLLDLNLPDMDGIDIANRLLDHEPDLKILAVSSQIDDYTLNRVIVSPIQGYVDKNFQSTEVLRQAIKAVVAGNVYFTSVVQETRRALGRNPHSFNKVLSEREQELLALLGRGLDDDEAGSQLGLTAQTVHSHRRNILRKLDLSGTKQLIRFALEHGFVRLNPPPRS
jgi:DNA-binding NarL/FixJ family response regulator